LRIDGRRSNPSQRCLKFMHIPKSAGSSIVHANLELPRAERPFKCLECEMLERLAAANPWYSGKLWQIDMHVNMTVAEQLNLSHLIEQRDGQPGDHCSEEHSPPNMDPGLAAFYLEDGCETFCVVREPVSRFLSAARMNLACLGDKGARCSPEGFEAWTRSHLAELRRRPCTTGCLFRRQVHMVYGAPRQSVAQAKYCGRILRYENITGEFNALMKEYGSSLTMPTDKFASFRYACNISTDTITAATRDMIIDYYRGDMAAFGYTQMA